MRVSRIAVRLTAQGDLNVAGLIRAGKGIAFPDGSIQRSAAMPTSSVVMAAAPDRKVTV